MLLILNQFLQLILSIFLMPPLLHINLLLQSLPILQTGSLDLSVLFLEFLFTSLSGSKQRLLGYISQRILSQKFRSAQVTGTLLSASFAARVFSKRRVQGSILFVLKLIILIKSSSTFPQKQKQNSDQFYFLIQSPIILTQNQLGVRCCRYRSTFYEIRMGGCGLGAPQAQSLAFNLRVLLVCFSQSLLLLPLSFMITFNYKKVTSMANSSLQELTNLKQQYDQLLDKNQDDLIKIKQKEKSMNEQLQVLKKQKAEQEHLFMDQIQVLQDQLNKKKDKGQEELTVTIDPNIKKINDLQIDARSLMDQNISLTAQNTNLSLQLQAQQHRNESLVQEVANLKQFIQSLERDMKALQADIHTERTNTAVNTQQPLITKQQLQSLQQQLITKQTLLDDLQEKNNMLNGELQLTKSQSKVLADSQRKYIKLVKKKENQLYRMQEQINKMKMSMKPTRKRTAQNLLECKQCYNLKQQIDLLKQMVKSTQGMVRVKQIQNHKYRLHSGQDLSLNHSKSQVRNSDKSTPLPPLKKK